MGSNIVFKSPQFEKANWTHAILRIAKKVIERTNFNLDTL